jgi:hypothetical protein
MIDKHTQTSDYINYNGSRKIAAGLRNALAYPVAPRDRGAGTMAALFKITLAIFLAAVLGYIALDGNGCDTTKSPSPTATPPPTKAADTSPEVTAEATKQDLLRCVEVTKETRLSPSQARIVSSPTGDLRPVWIVSGRVRNTCPESFEDLTFSIED